MKKLLYWQWHSFLKQGLEQGLKSLGAEVTTFFYQLKDWEEDEAFQQQFRKALEKEAFDAVISINFNPIISAICQEKGVPYLSWVYDSPLHIRDLSPLKNEVNRTFFFDRGMAEAFREQGIAAEHLALAGDLYSFQKRIREASAAERKRFSSGISMVGKLYQTEYQHQIGPLTQYQRGCLEGILASQSRVYGGYFIPEVLTEELLSGINEKYRAASGGKTQISMRQLEYLLACEVTARERFLAMTLLSGRFPVDLYGGDKDSRLSERKGEEAAGIRYHGYIDYYSEMPLVFAFSDINLNISLKCIRTGVPLRVFDVLSCGGFLITSFQAELPELFELGSELVAYGSMEELVSLCDYYEKHEAERRGIAENGRRRIETDYTPEKQLEKILKKI